MIFILGLFTDIGPVAMYIHFGIDLLELFCDLNAVHSSHVNIKEGNVAAVFLGVHYKLILIVKSGNVRIGLCFFDRKLQHLQCQLLIVNAEYPHCSVLLWKQPS